MEGRQLQVVQHRHSTLHRIHYHTWLGRSYAITQGLGAGRQSTKVNWSSACGLFLMYPASALIAGPYASSSQLSYNMTKTKDKN